MSSLRLIKETTAVAGVTTIDITDVFSSDYDIYKITFNIDGNSTTAFDVHARFINSSGTVLTNSKYDRAFLNMITASAFSENKGTNSSKFDAGFSTSDQDPEFSAGTMYVFTPFLTSAYTFIIQQSFTVHTALEVARKYIGVYKDLTSITGIQAIASSSAFAAGTKIRVYGLRVDS